MNARMRARLKTLARVWGEWEEREITDDQRRDYPVAENVYRTFLNNRFHVQIYRIETGWGEVLQLTVGRHGDLGQPSWSELQRIKNELIGRERVAVQVFPAESHLVDQADLLHLWVLPKGFELPFGLHLPSAWGMGRRL